METSSRNYDLENHVYDVTWWAGLSSPYRCNIVTDIFSSWDDCKIAFSTWNEALALLIKDILNFVNKDSYLFDIRFEEKKEVASVDKTAHIEIQHEMIDFICALMYDNWCEKVEEILYNYAD